MKRLFRLLCTEIHFFPRSQSPKLQKAIAELDSTETQLGIALSNINEANDMNQTLATYLGAAVALLDRAYPDVDSHQAANIDQFFQAMQTGQLPQ